MIVIERHPVFLQGGPPEISNAQEGLEYLLMNQLHGV